MMIGYCITIYDGKPRYYRDEICDRIFEERKKFICPRCYFTSSNLEDIVEVRNDTRVK